MYIEIQPTTLKRVLNLDVEYIVINRPPPPYYIINTSILNADWKPVYDPSPTPAQHTYLTNLALCAFNLTIHFIPE